MFLAQTHQDGSGVVPYRIYMSVTCTQNSPGTLPRALLWSDMLSWGDTGLMKSPQDDSSS
jgi:hypothetical protein